MGELDAQPPGTRCDATRTLRVVPLRRRAHVFSSLVVAAMASAIATKAGVAAQVLAGLASAFLTHAAIGRIHVEADAQGLRSQGPFRSRRLAWHQVEDYFIGHDGIAVVRGSSIRIRWSRTAVGAGDLEECVVERATNARTRAFERIGHRLTDLPATFGRDPGLAWTGVILVVSSLGISAKLLHTFHRIHVGIAALGAEAQLAFAAIACAMLALPGFALWLGLSSWTRQRHASRALWQVTLSVQGLVFERNSEVCEVPWSAITQVADVGTQVRFEWGGTSCLVDPGSRHVAFRALLDRFAPVGTARRTGADDCGLADLVPVVREGGVTTFTYRTRIARAMLVFAWLLVPLLLGPFIGRSIRSSADLVVAGVVVVGICGYAAWLATLSHAYRNARLEIDSTAFTRHAGRFSLRVPLDELRRVRPLESGWVELEYGGRSTTIFLITTGGDELVRTLLAHADARGDRSRGGQPPPE